MIQGKTIAVHYSNRKQKFENWLCNAVSVIFELIPQYFSFFLFAYCNKNTQSMVVAVWSVQFSEEAEVFQVWRVKSWWVFPLKMSFLSLCENEQFIIYPAWCFLALIFVGDSTGVNGLNVECQQPGEYSGDSKCFCFVFHRWQKGCKTKNVFGINVIIFMLLDFI